MKKQILLLAAMMMAVCSYAQVWKAAPGNGVQRKAPAKVNKATITPTDGQMWWGYMNESELSNSTTIGIGSPTSFITGIYVPANNEQIGGATVKAVRVYIADELASTMSNMKVWISKTLPETIANADYVQDIKETLTDGANDFELTTPYEVNNGAFYIGYYVSSTNAYPIMSCGSDAIDAFLICAPGQVEWDDLNGYGFGKLAFQILVEGATIVEESATPFDFPTAYTIVGNEVTVGVDINNNGSNTINNISYTITANGTTTEEKTITTPAIAYNAKASVNITFPASSDPKKVENEITITKVNGVANGASNKSAKGNIINMTDVPTVVPVIEEFTGTWCGWCPVGFVGLQSIHDTYGDKVVLIAVHESDPMTISDYSPILNQVSSFPSSFVNRAYDVYPHPVYLKSAVSQVLTEVVPGSVTATAEWADADKKAIKVNTETTFYYTDDNGQYGIALALIEDGMKGTGSNWSQTNNLSHNADYNNSDFSFWYNAASKVTGLEFDHVAVAAWNIASGISGSVNSTITAGEVQEFSYTADISANSLIQDKSKLKVVALLIDKSNGRILNASETSIQGDASGILSIGTDAAQPVEFYTIDGKLLNAPQKGLNIVKYADGSVKKVMMK